METLTREGTAADWFMPVKETAGKPPWELPEPVTDYKPGEHQMFEQMPLGALSRCYADIEPEDTSWIWRNKLPIKDAVLGAGDGGIGKGLFIADLVARVTHGDEMGDGSEGLSEPQNVVLITPEDHIRRAMAWRLRAAEADLRRVFDLTRVLGHEFTIPDDLPLLQKEIKAIGNVALVVIDPLSQVVDKNLTSVKFVRRSVWSPLRQMAEDTSSCFLGMHHLTKAGSVAGSAALVQAARILLRFSKHEMDEELVQFEVDKTNIGAKGSPVFYRKVGDGHDIHVEYEEHDIMPEMGRTGEAQKRLLWTLKENGPKHYKELAADAGISEGQARVIMHRLKREGLVNRAGLGIYEAA